MITHVYLHVTFMYALADSFKRGVVLFKWLKMRKDCDDKNDDIINESF